MARGDVVADIVTIANNANHSVQPGSGVEWVIKNVALSQGTSGLLRGYDGSSVAPNCDGSHAAVKMGDCTIPITNGNYVQIRNSNIGSDYPFGYYGYITKD